MSQSKGGSVVGAIFGIAAAIIGATADVACTVVSTVACEGVKATATVVGGAVDLVTGKKKKD